MAKFDNLYLDQEDREHGGSEITYAEGIERECAVCGTSTHWIDLNAFAYLCSEECQNEYWAKFAEAYNAS